MSGRPLAIHLLRLSSWFTPLYVCGLLADLPYFICTLLVQTRCVLSLLLQAQQFSVMLPIMQFMPMCLVWLLYWNPNNLDRSL